MKYGSVCSGIEAATSAWHGLGWTPEFFSEIEPFPSAVLKHHYPEIPNHGDMTKYKEWPDANIDVLVGGTPCQSFSVAGLRKGLDDPRGNLMLTFGAIAERYRPSWLVWENVPGVLSSNKGRDFGTFLGMLGQLGYGFAYRVLDAQYFGVAQRRRRVFVVGYLGDWRRAAAVLFERESLSGDIAPSRKKREEVAGTITSGLDRRRGAGIEPGTLVSWPAEIASTLDTTMQKKQGLDNQHINAGAPLFVPHGYHTTGAGHWKEGSGTLRAREQDSHENLITYGIDEECNVNKDMLGPLLRGGQGGTRQAVALGIPGNWIGRKPENGSNQVQPNYEHSPCLTKTDQHAVCSKMQVRRLTPIECERLQGFPDNYTQIPWRNKPAANCPDGPRYKALGNSMAVPVMKWIGERIQHIEGLSS